MNGPEGLSAQTFQPYLSNIQINKQNTERLKGFSGEKIAYRKRLFQAVSPCHSDSAGGKRLSAG